MVILLEVTRFVDNGCNIFDDSWNTVVACMAGITGSAGRVAKAAGKCPNLPRVPLYRQSALHAATDFAHVAGLVDQDPADYGLANHCLWECPLRRRQDA